MDIKKIAIGVGTVVVGIMLYNLLKKYVPSIP